MHYKWLARGKSKDLLVFFSGWAMDETSVCLNYDNYDFLVFYNYGDTSLEEALLEECKGYHNVYMVAWSMGVMMAPLLISKLNNVKASIAINGTLDMLHNTLGIPLRIFETTLKNLNTTTLQKFFDNMGYKDFAYPAREFESQLLELKSLKEFFFRADRPRSNFDLAIIASNDLIVPVKNQLKAWEGTKSLMVDGGHYIFNLWPRWDEILNLTNQN